MNKRTLLILIVALMPFCKGFAQRMQLSTNALGWMCLGTMNAELNVAVAKNWSVGVSGKYNPFTYGSKANDGSNHQFQIRQRSVAALARWWPWHIYSGWWVAGKAQWQEYNMGGIISSSTEEGQCVGGGLSAGYSHMISTHLNVEMGLGLWGGLKNYVVYACPTCGRITGSGIKPFVMPDNLTVALSYVF